MPKIVLVIVAVIAVAGGIILASGGSQSQTVIRDARSASAREAQAQQGAAVRGARSRNGGDGKLVGFQPLPDAEGPMCEPTLVAGLMEPQQETRRAAPPATVPPSADPSGQIAKRQ